MSVTIPITSGLDQGCPLSDILQSFSNAFVSQTLDKERKETGSLFVTDTCIGVEGDSFEEPPTP